MLSLSLLSRGHGKLVQSKQKLEVFFEPEVSLGAGWGEHILRRTRQGSSVLVSVGANTVGVTGRSSLLI